MSYELPPLPYEKDALAPHISPETLEYHYGKHHKSYVDNLNRLLENEATMPLEALIKTAQGGIFNNAAQIWNHTFYWHCLSPSGGGEPTGALAEAIRETFGDFNNFKEQFTKTALTTFGSGWAWLTKTPEGELSIVSSSNADNPLVQNHTPLLTCDVWEHAYYIDYRNVRPDYVNAFWALVNWDFVNDNLNRS